MTPRASIIICTRNRAQSLDTAVRSLFADPSAVTRELVVVDNGSTDSTASLLAGLAAKAPFSAKLVHEPRIGHSNARNRGVREARGELILFTDDDVTVHPGWADGLVSKFEVPHIGAVGGRVLPRFSQPVPTWMEGPHLRPFALTDYGPIPRELSWRELTLPYGANVAFRRSVLPTCEPFHTGLGHTGKVRFGHDEWHVLRLIERTHGIAYAPEAVVEHLVDPTRLDWHRVRQGYFQLGFGHSRHERLLGERRPDRPRVLIRAVRAYIAARAVAKRNGGLSAPTADEAWEEFNTYLWAGREIEALLAGAPRLASWAAAHLA